MSNLLEHATADLSDDGVYRYRLTRQWDHTKPSMVFAMLNPSTADADADDATIRKCRKLAKREDCGGIVVVNLFAYRATKPKQLRNAADPVGPENQAWIEGVLDVCAAEDGLLICAWGAWWASQPKSVVPRRLNVEWLARERGVVPYRYGPETLRGDPGHPLYVKDDAPIERFAVTEQIPTLSGSPWLIRF